MLFAMYKYVLVLEKEDSPELEEVEKKFEKTLELNKKISSELLVA